MAFQRSRFGFPVFCLAWCLLPAWLGLGPLGLGPQPQASAQTVPDQAQPLQHPAIAGASVARMDHQLYVMPAAASEQKTATLPRMAASLKSVQWLGHSQATAPSLTPEPDHWVLRWDERPAGAAAIVLSFDQYPQLLSELQPIQPVGDGSIWLPACQARTAGEKVRYEPQSFKNTVGYWTGKQDTASWTFQLDQPGSFNVAILQGCGKDQGGSAAQLQVSSESTATVSLQFEVLETGHFQNFQWRHLGTLSLDQAGVYTLQLAPRTIKKAALMDVRMIQLARLPAPK